MPQDQPWFTAAETSATVGDQERYQVDRDIELARAAGWTLIPQVGLGSCDNALMRRQGEFTDVITIPAIGPSVAVRLRDAAKPGHPRSTGYEWWRYQVPVEVAIAWVLSDPADNQMLVERDLSYPHFQPIEAPGRKAG